MRSKFASTLIALAVIALASGAMAQVSDKVFIQGARIVPVEGPEIESGSILIEGGKITAVGKDLKAPFDAKVVDAAGLVAVPGAVDPYTSRGLDVSNENLDVAPFLEVYDAIDPSDRYFEEALRNGLTTLHITHAHNCVIGGVSRLVRPIGLKVDEMTVWPDAGLPLSFFPKRGYDHSVQMAMIRDTFAELDRYLGDLAEKLYAEEQKKNDDEVRVAPAEARKKGKELVKLSKVDDKHRNLVRMREGGLETWAWCNRAMDVGNAVDFIKTAGIEDSVTFVLGSETFKAVDHLKQAKRPVIVEWNQVIHRERNRMTREMEDTFLPSVLHGAKVDFAVAGMENPWAEMARLVRNGIPQDVALRAITLNAARAIGQGHRFGSLEKGKDGNVVLMSAHPSDSMAWVQHVFIEGRHVYDRAKDKRMRDLIQGVYDTEEERKKAAEAAKKAESKDEGKKDGEAKDASAEGKNDKAAESGEKK